MIYEFRTEAGERVELDYPIGRAPKIGSWVTRGGRRLRRVPSVGAAPYVEPDRGFICFSQHPDDVASPHRVKVEGVEFAAVSSKRQIEETLARKGGEMRYGDGLGKVDGGTRWV